jgi:hypothetical protein
MILEVDPEAIRDIAAAVHAARRIEPEIEILIAVERKVMTAIRTRSETLELEDQEAQALRNVLQRRAYEQRNTTEGNDYSDLADRISTALDIGEPPPLLTTEATES